jgi:hypothetical protein
MFTSKAACVLTSGICQLICSLPPSSSKSVDAKKDDKITTEEWPFKYIHLECIAAALFCLTETILYIILMVRGDSISSSIDVQGLRELKTWQLVATVFCVLGTILRKWSFITLGRFFTVSKPTASL